MRKQSQDDQILQGMNAGSAIQTRVERLQAKSQKMYEKIDQLICQTIQAIDESQKEAIQAENDWGNALLKLHVKMTEIKPLKSMKDEYNDFYKKLTGFGKVIEETTTLEVQPKIIAPQLFDEKDIEYIQQSLSDHYLSQRNYQAAQSIKPSNGKKDLFEECYQINQEILEGKFDRAAEWVRNAGLNGDDNKVAYQIQKMKVIKLVRDGKADQAIAYLRQNLSSYVSQNGNQISKLMNFVITQSQKYWGSQSQYTEIYKDRYNTFISVQLEELSAKFTNIYLKTNKIYMENPIAKCHEVGIKFKQQFLQHLKYIPTGKQLPKVLPFSIKSGTDNKYHSQFFCPVNKQMYGPLDKNIVLSCGHMVSHSAITRLMQGRDSRRKTKCPICQSDQIFEQHLRVQF